MQADCYIDGFGPLPVERPASVAELGAIVSRAAVDGAAVYPLGGRTRLDLGNRPIKAGLAVDVCGLDQVIDFPSRDMTVTVQAGIRMNGLQALLAPENLRLPIDVPEADRATLGGSIAANTSGPRRYGFGTLRDYVIGISAVNDAGKEFKAGGRVVKNVAGYDLCKLLVGSLGTLGIITQVTLKLRPLAEEQALIVLGCAADGLETLLEQLHATATRPVCIELLNRRAAAEVFRRADMEAPASVWAVVVGYEGNEEAVRWQVQQLIVEVGAASQLAVRIGFTTGPLWDALVSGAGRTEAPLSFKASVLPSAVAAFCRAADAEPDAVTVQASAGSGIVRGHWQAGLTETRAAALRASWRGWSERGGTVVVERCPPEWKRAVPVWDALPAGALMRAVKEKLDPNRVFNPGRFVEGI
jgi:glycolate oxidase FAD binding subunit